MTGEITEAKDLEEVPVAIVGVSIVDVTINKSAQDLPILVWGKSKTVNKE